VTLLHVMQALDALFKRDRNQQADRDDRDMDEEVPPRVDGGVESVDI
jgi:hypothetical protein